MAQAAEASTRPLFSSTCAVFVTDRLTPPSVSNLNCLRSAKEFDECKPLAGDDRVDHYGAAAASSAVAAAAAAQATGDPAEAITYFDAALEIRKGLSHDAAATVVLPPIRNNEFGGSEFGGRGDYGIEVWPG
jgi:hypothetical protein